MLVVVHAVVSEKECRVLDVFRVLLAFFWIVLSCPVKSLQLY